MADKNYDLNILIVEDDYASRFLLEKLFDIYSCSSDSVTNGKDALFKTKTTKYDLIFMDIILFDTNGIDLMDEIRATNDFYKEIPFIPYTAELFPKDLQKYNDRGMHYLLPKPFELNRLEEILDEIKLNKFIKDKQLKFFD